MLKDDFYKITTIQKENQSYTIMLTLNKDHSIFQGHFPGQPIVPGACLIQMLKEITEMVLDKNLLLKKADSIKFLRPIDPNEASNLQMLLNITEDDGIKTGLSAVLSNQAAVFFKFMGQFHSTGQLH